jgi:hypothetical protein
MKKKLIIFLITILTWFLFNTSVTAYPITLNPEADTYVWSDVEDTNYEDLGLWVGHTAGGGIIARSYLRFDLTTIPSGMVVG